MYPRLRAAVLTFKILIGRYDDAAVEKGNRLFEWPAVSQRKTHGLCSFAGVPCSSNDYRMQSNERENRARPRPTESSYNPSNLPNQGTGVFVTRVPRTTNLCPCLESKYDGNHRAEWGTPEPPSRRCREKNFQL